MQPEQPPAGGPPERCELTAQEQAMFRDVLAQLDDYARAHRDLSLMVRGMIAAVGHLHGLDPGPWQLHNEGGVLVLTRGGPP